MKTLAIDLHKLSRAVNIALFFLMLLCFGAGFFISFYFHFLSVALLFVNVINLSYLFGQKQHTLLRNFGILAQGRYLIESIGPELRQYLYSSDTEERPFNRDQRSEIYRKAYNIDSALSFGSLLETNTFDAKIKHSMYPVIPTELESYSVTFGEERGLSSAFTVTQPIMISAMSYGALGANAVRALARGAAKAGIPMNTGEGGYPKYHLMEECSLIFQIGTAKFGVRNPDGSLNDQKLIDLAKKPQIKMVEIKFSQGAKPGKGGLLPKEKVSDEIAEIRGVEKGVDVVSPPGHLECKDPKSTVQFIAKIQKLTGLPTGMKLCLGQVEEFRALIQEMKTQEVFPDFITVDGAEGGTGAAPKPFLDQVGTPLLAALSTVQEILVDAGVRDRLKLCASGKLINAGKIIEALSIGADVCYSARGFMLSLGCIQALQCGNNTCPVGITTHDPSLQRGLDIEKKSERVKNYVSNIEHDFEQLLAATGRASYKDLSMDNLYIPRHNVLSKESND